MLPPDLAEKVYREMFGDSPLGKPYDQKIIAQVHRQGYTIPPQPFTLFAGDAHSSKEYRDGDIIYQLNQRGDELELVVKRGVYISRYGLVTENRSLDNALRYTQHVTPLETTYLIQGSPEGPFASWSTKKPDLRFYS